MDFSAQNNHFPVVGIGASAGGLNAFKRLLGAIPEKSGIAYVLIQHLAPAHESMLPELLSRVTKIPVHEITDDINLAPDNIYIIPENKIVTASEGVLKLSPREGGNKPNLPIDIFFKSIAEVHKSFAIGVILSGTAFDGTEGLKAIKEHGGVTIAQDLDTAAFPGMPLSAIKADVVDFVLSPENIPEQLLKLKRSYLVNYADGDDNNVSKKDEEIYKQIITMLRVRTGNDFSNYKQATIRRRIARRMAATDNAEDLSQYLNFLRTNKDEQDELFKDILIPVTYFFRDPKTYEELSSEVFPQLLKNKKNSDTLRIWVAGCSTGEEAYSIAICLHEFFVDTLPGLKIQLFASDISEHVIAKARNGIYSKQDVKHISAVRLHQFFIKSGNDYQVGNIIREMCVFAVHNFLKDPPFAKMDLISCRNVLIYMDVLFQKKALTTFHYALNANGFLLLGKSESVSTSPDLFTVFDKQHKIYSRKNGSGSFMRIIGTQQHEEVFSSRRNYLVKHEAKNDFLKSAESILFLKYTPPSIIVNSQMDIVHFHGDLSLIIMQPQGKPNFNILKMARHELVFELRNALAKSKKAKSAVSTEKIPVSINEEMYLISAEIIPLNNIEETHYLFVFKAIHIIAESAIEKGISSGTLKQDKANLRIQQLEAELNHLREDIRTVTEDQEIFNEELQSANEELLSSSEELQSVNEELETSKEELQASNEELASLNQELLDRQDQLFSARYFAEAIVNSVNEAILVLDKNLRIRSANDIFYKLFNTNEINTEGKFFTDLNQGQWNNGELQKQLKTVLPEISEFKNLRFEIDINDQETSIFLISGRKLVNPKSNALMILLVIQDISKKG